MGIKSNLQKKNQNSHVKKISPFTEYVKVFNFSYIEFSFFSCKLLLIPIEAYSKKIISLSLKNSCDEIIGNHPFDIKIYTISNCLFF